MSDLPYQEYLNPSEWFLFGPYINSYGRCKLTMSKNTENGFIRTDSINFTSEEQTNTWIEEFNRRKGTL